LTFRFNPSKN